MGFKLTPRKLAKKRGFPKCEGCSNPGNVMMFLESGRARVCFDCVHKITSHHRKLEKEWPRKFWLSRYVAGGRDFLPDEKKKLSRLASRLQRRATYTQVAINLLPLLPWGEPVRILPLPLEPYRERCEFYRWDPLPLPVTREEFDEMERKEADGVREAPTKEKQQQARRGKKPFTFKSRP